MRQRCGQNRNRTRKVVAQAKRVQLIQLFIHGTFAVIPLKILPVHKSITINDVAAQSGVSYQTVSRVINGHPNVKASTRARVLEVIGELQYRPNLTAQNLASRRSTVIGVVSFGTSEFGPAWVMVSIEQAARDRGYNVMVAGVTELTAEKIHHVDELCSHQVNGFLLNLPLRLNLNDVREVCRGVPFVTLDTDLGADVPSVRVDQQLGSRIATRHLVELGHSKIAHISGPSEWNAGHLRKLGWMRTLQKAKLRPGPCLVGDWSAKSGYDLAGELLKDHAGEFTAVVSANDAMAPRRGHGSDHDGARRNDPESDGRCPLIIALATLTMLRFED